jgi:hypothetical protein
MLRVLAVSLGMWIAYRWKIRERPTATKLQPERTIPLWFYGTLLLIFMLAFWLEYFPFIG